MASLQLGMLSTSTTRLFVKEEDLHSESETFTYMCHVVVLVCVQTLPAALTRSLYDRVQQGFHRSAECRPSLETTSTAYSSSVADHIAFPTSPRGGETTSRPNGLLPWSQRCLPATLHWVVLHSCGKRRLHSC